MYGETTDPNRAERECRLQWTPTGLISYGREIGSLVASVNEVDIQSVLGYLESAGKKVDQFDLINVIDPVVCNWVITVYVGGKKLPETKYTTYTWGLTVNQLEEFIRRGYVLEA